MHKNITLLSTQQAAEYLHDKLGGLRDWRYFLSDNRKPRASTYKIPCAKLGGKGYWYAKADLDDYIAFERDRLRGRLTVTKQRESRVPEISKAFGLSRQAYDPENGAPWETGSFTALLDVPQSNDTLSVRLLTPKSPFGYFRLTPDQARQLAQELLDAAAQIGRAASTQSKGDDEYAA